MAGDKVYGVYTHARPESAGGGVFYVGKGTVERSRDFRSRGIHHKRILHKDGKDNVLVKFFPCRSEEDAFAEEQILIAACRMHRIPLINRTNGGEGTSGFRWSARQRQQLVASLNQPQTREKISRGVREALARPEVRANISAGLKSAWQRPGVRAKRGAAIKVALNKPETKAKRSAAIKAAYHNDPVGAARRAVAISKGSKGKKISEECKRKISEKLRGRKLTPEHRAKMSSAFTGRVFTPEHRLALKAAANRPGAKEKFSAAVKAAWITRRLNNERKDPI